MPSTVFDIPISCGLITSWLHFTHDKSQARQTMNRWDENRNVAFDLPDQMQARAHVCMHESGPSITMTLYEGIQPYIRSCTQQSATYTTIFCFRVRPVVWIRGSCSNYMKVHLLLYFDHPLGNAFPLLHDVFCIFTHITRQVGCKGGARHGNTSWHWETTEVKHSQRFSSTPAAIVYARN